MTCPFARNDAAYVLGALEPEERHRYEEHLRECPSCAAAVRELAGLPGLLARLPVGRVAELSQDDPEPGPPATLLPALLRRVRRERRWSRWRVGLATGAVAASLAAGGAVAVQHLAAPSGPPPPARTVALEAVGNRPVHGTVQLIPWDWGTTVRVTCHYGYTIGGGRSSSEVYTLYVTDRAGAEYRVSSWRSLDADVTVPGGIALPVDDVVAFKVKDDHQTVVMEGG